MDMDTLARIRRHHIGGGGQLGVHDMSVDRAANISAPIHHATISLAARVKHEMVGGGIDCGVVVELRNLVAVGFQFCNRVDYCGILCGRDGGGLAV